MKKILATLSLLTFLTLTQTPIFIVATTQAQGTTRDACPAPTEQQTETETKLKQKYQDIEPLPDINFNIKTDKEWADLNSDDLKYQYCRQLEYLNERISLASLNIIQDCSLQNLDPQSKNKLQDAKCTQLLCKSNSVTSHNYYKDATEARYLKEAKSSECEINKSPLASCLQDRDTKIKTCQDCRSEIDQHNTKQAQNQESSLSATCSKYQNVNNCTTHFVCAENKNTPTEQQTSGRAPFETEFFDVTSVEKGLSTNQNQNFKTDHEGGALIGVINTIANFLVKMITTISLLVFIIGAFILITANGEENQLNRGKDAIKYSLLGIVIVMLSYTIVVLTQSALF